MKKEIRESGRMHRIMERLKRVTLDSKITEVTYGLEILKLESAN